MLPSEARETGKGAVGRVEYATVFNGKGGYWGIGNERPGRLSLPFAGAMLRRASATCRLKTA